MVRDALPPQMFAELRQVLWDLRAQKIAEGRLETETIRQATFSGANRLQEEPVIQRLITNPRVLAKVTDILGANIYVYHAHTNVTPPAEPGTEMPAEYDGMRSWGFHQGPPPRSPPFSPLLSGLELTALRSQTRRASTSRWATSSRTARAPPTRGRGSRSSARTT